MSLHLLMLKPIAQVLQKRGIEPLERLRLIWPVLLPGGAGKLSCPAEIIPPNLIVYADNAAVNQELQLRARELLSLIARLGLLPEHPDLQEIKTRPSPPNADARRPHPGFGALMPPPTQSLAPKVRGALEDVEDPELRAQLERISRLRREQKK